MSFIATDWLNTETIKRPPTLVVVPRTSKGGKDSLSIDIKYVDFTGMQDVPLVYPEAECYIVPPYKHLAYITVYSPKSELDIYAIRGKSLKTVTLRFYFVGTFLSLFVYPMKTINRNRSRKKF